ncbi:hypothetical protein BH09BAC5_BH09BAC5_29780 [soil metagenome]
MALNWLEQHLLPCPFKAVTGIDCPGCGLQRSFFELLRGNLSESIHLYPALIPVILTLVFLALHLKFRFKYGAKILLSMVFVTTGIIIVFYIVKQVSFLSQC